MKKLFMKFTQNFLMQEPILLKLTRLIQQKFLKQTTVVKIFHMNLILKEEQLQEKAADDSMAKSNNIKFVAGVVGPTNRTCSMSPDVNNPGFRNVSFDDLQSDYEISINALVDSGVDFIMIETIFDTLNAKAALMALKKS